MRKRTPFPLAAILALCPMAATLGSQEGAGATNASWLKKIAGEGGANQRDLGPKPLSARQILFNLRDRIGQLAQKLGAPDARGIAATALADVNFMIERWTPTIKVPPEYSANLQLSLQLLDAALTSAEEGPAFSALQRVADDLHVKAEHCRKSGIGLGGMVTVVVRTKKGDREQRNLQVLYMPKLMEVVKNAQPEQFPKFSSPTSHALPPGRYIMWTREPSTNVTGGRTIVRIGGGNSTEEWDLPSP
jgi:hypothetical protein